MNKKNIATRILSCLLVLCLLLSSVLTISFTQDTRAEENLKYVLKTFSYPTDKNPVLWKYPGESYARPLSNTYYRGASVDDKDNFKYVAYCMDWGVQGPSSSGSSYDHPTTTISQEKINQLTYVLMNGYSGADAANAKSNTFTLTNKYKVNRYGRPLTLTDDGGTGTMCMQTATQIAVWLIMGKDGRGRDMYESGWVSNENCENLDKDIMEMATTLYKDALANGSEIDWLSVNVSDAVAGVYNSTTDSKLYGPFLAKSEFVKNNLKVSLTMSNAPSGSKLLDESLKEISSIDVGKRFYVSVPADAKDATIKIGLMRDMGRVLPLSYEEENENRQRMFFSSLSSAATTLTVVHSQSDATLTINKQVNDAAPNSNVSLSSPKGYTFMVYYLKDAKATPQYLGDFETDDSGKIKLTGLTPGIYQVVEAMNYSQEQVYESIVVEGFTDANGNPLAKGEDYKKKANTSNGVISFEIKSSGLEKNYNVYFLNQRHDATKLTITKIDQYTGEYISGAHFRIYKMVPRASGTGFDYAKDDAGNYIFYDGYTYDDSMGQVIFGRTETNKGSKYLPLDLVFTNGEVLENNNTYRVVEKTPIVGYKSDDFDMKFAVSNDEVNKVIALYNHTETYTDNYGNEKTGYYVTNRPYVNALKVTKYEKGTQTPIAGVQFALYEKLYGELNYLTSITTDSNGVATYGYNANGEIDTENGNALRYGREYYIVETAAPSGYIINDEMIKIDAVTKDLEVISVTVENDKIKDGSFEIVKTNDKNDPLGNTEFTLYRVKDEYYNEFDEFFISYKGLNTVENSEYKYLTYFLDNNKKIDLSEVEQYLEVVKTYKTDSSGIIKQTIPEGEYILLETKATNGFNLLNSIYRFSVYKTESHYRIECVNDPITGSVILNKTNSSNGEYISGVEFTLYKKNDVISQPDIKIGAYETDANGKVLVENLEYGEYYFLETKTPDRFVKPDDAETKEETKFIIDVQGETENIDYANDEKPCTVIVYKTEKGSDKPIAGAKFALMNGDTKVAEAVTDADGIATFTDLELGEYKLVELATAPGYDIDSFEAVTVSVTNYTTHKVYVNNEKIKADIKILKVDKDSEKPLEGVEFSLYDANDLDNALRTLKTDKDGIIVFEDVEFGSYIVIETKTLNGYKVSETKTLVNVEEKKEYFYTVANEMIKRNIKLIKVDKDTTIPIANVEFDVFALVGDEYVKYTTVTTDENGECNFTLPFGEYELRETKTGKGYKISSETTKIDLTTEDIEDILQITITNELIKNKITLRKSGDEVGNYLAGAKYGLYDLATDKLILEGVTDENGIFCFGTISYGSYYLKEIEAPEGYTLSSDIHKFTVDENSPEEQIIDVVDTAVPQTGFNSNMLLVTFLMALSACLFAAIVVLETKARAKAYN